MNYYMAINPEWHEPDMKVQVSTLMKKKTMIEKELRAKIELGDARIAIATLVLSSSNRETRTTELKSSCRHFWIRGHCRGRKPLSNWKNSRPVEGGMPNCLRN